MQQYKIGQAVHVTHDNYGQDAIIVAYRDDDATTAPPSHWKVRRPDGHEFWAFDFEIRAAGYDSTDDTNDHINKVQARIGELMTELMRRATRHDMSKLREPEKSGYDVLGELIQGVKYGTPEYAAVMNDPRVKPAIDHHVTTNRHHPQAHASIADMTLLDINELLCDIKAASERASGMPLREILAGYCEYWGFSEQLASILANTVEELGW